MLHSLQTESCFVLHQLACTGGKKLFTCLGNQSGLWKGFGRVPRSGKQKMLIDAFVLYQVHHMSARGEAHNIRHFETQAFLPPPSGARRLDATYIHELIIRTLPLNTKAPLVFQAYSGWIQSSEAAHVALWRFEIELLKELGDWPPSLAELEGERALGHEGDGGLSPEQAASLIQTPPDTWPSHLASAARHWLDQRFALQLKTPLKTLSMRCAVPPSGA